MLQSEFKSTEVVAQKPPYLVRVLLWCAEHIIITITAYSATLLYIYSLYFCK
jgi:hypothetical protein